MKTRFLKVFAGLFLLAMFACNNETKKEETTTIKEEPAKKETPAEPKKTEISVSSDGAEVKTKSGTEVKVGETGASVGSKDVKIDVKKKDEKQ
jgi:hypothetical protein